MIDVPPWHLWFTAGAVVAMIAALAREVARPDLILFGTLTVLLVMGIVPPEVGLAGLANPAVLTIAALFVVAAGVERTDGLAFLDGLLFTRTRSVSVVLLRFMAPTALLSAVVNNTPLVAMLMPRLQRWAAAADVPASKVLLPLSYAAILGGMITLLGTSTNLVVSGLLVQLTGRGFGMFDLTWVGLPVAVVGVLFIALVGHRLLPSHGTAPLVGGGSRGGYLFELRVPAGSPLCGQTVEAAGLRALGDAYLTHLHRGPHVVGPTGPHDVLEGGDVLAFTGDAGALDRLLVRPGLERVVAPPAPDARLPLFEAVVAASSPLVGKTLRETSFRDRFGGVVVAIRRSDGAIGNRIGRTPIEAGDLLLVEARAGFAERWNADREMFYLVAPCRAGQPVPRPGKAPLALALLAGIFVTSAAGLMPLVTAALVAAIVMLATGCVDVEEARRAINLPILLMIAAALGVGSAVERTGLAAVLAATIVDATRAGGPFAVLAGLYLATNVMTEVLTNAAAAALLVPIAVAAAANLGVDPLPFAIAVAVAASAGFSTPFGYQTNLMVMAAGGYRFTDYVRAGLPLNVLVMAVALLAIWIVWF